MSPTRSQLAHFRHIRASGVTPLPAFIRIVECQRNQDGAGVAERPPTVRQVYAIAMALAMRGGVTWPETREEAVVLLRRLIDGAPACSTIGQGEP